MRGRLFWCGLCLVAASVEAAGVPWSTPGGELSLELPEGWSAHFDAGSWTVTFAYPLGPGEASRSLLQGRRLPPGAQGGEIRNLAPQGVALLRRQYPTMVPGEIAYPPHASGLKAAEVEFQGVVPALGGAARSWVGFLSAGDYAVTLYVWGRQGPALTDRVRQARQLFASLRGAAPRRDVALESSLVGTWVRVSDIGRPGFLATSQETLRFLPGGRYLRETEGMTNVTTERVGSTPGSTAYLDSSSRDHGSYQVLGGNLVARSEVTGEEAVVPVRLDQGELEIAGGRYRRGP